jgi:hypothetical protein
MGQVEIISFLKNNPGREFSEKELTNALGRKFHINRPLRALRKYPPENLQIKQVKGYRNFDIFVYTWRDV